MMQSVANPVVNEEVKTESDLADAAKIRYLSADNTVFSKTPGNMLSVKVEEEEHPTVYVHCSFPHTNKRIYLSIRTIENKEIGMIRSLDDWPTAMADLLDEQVQMRSCAPESANVGAGKLEVG